MKHMLTLAAVAGLVLSSPATAQMPSADSMKALEAAAAEMERCFQKDGFEERMADLEKQAEAADNKINALCTAGKRDDAKRLADKEYATLLKHPAFVELSACSKQLAKHFSFADSASDEDEKDIHVCDEI